MNPYPFELLNHFTVPCTSCLLWTVTPGGGIQQDAAMSTNCAECIKMELGVNRSENLVVQKSPYFPIENRFNSTAAAYASHKSGNKGSRQSISHPAIYLYESSVSVHSTGTPAPLSFHPLPAELFPPSILPPAK